MEHFFPTTMRRSVTASLKSSASSPQTTSPTPTTSKRYTRSSSVIKSRNSKIIAICFILAPLIILYFKFHSSLRLIGTEDLSWLPPTSSSSFGEHPNTVVTAYFSIRSKYKTSEYAKWMSTMLSLQDAMVIFCSPDMYDTIKSLRIFANNRTMIITMKLEDLPLAQKYSLQQWQAQYEQDPEKRRHASYYLFWIWLSKTYFVTRAVELNPFHSKYFMWSDIGCFRSQRDTSRWKDQTMMVRSAQVILNDRMLFLAHHTPNPPPNVWWTAKLKEPQHFYHSGTMMAGTSDTWPRFHAAFLLTLNGFFERGMFVGDDQPVLQCTCLQNPDLCLYVTHLKGDNHYFGLRSVLQKGSNNQAPYYQVWTPPSVLINEDNKHSNLTAKDVPSTQKVSSTARFLVDFTNDTDVNAMVFPSTATTTMPLFPYNMTGVVKPFPLVHHAEATIVTAYFKLPSKFDVSKYDTWMEYMLSLQDAMVVFTSEDLVAKIQSYRAHALDRTVIIPMSLEQLPLARQYSASFWQKQLAIDRERKVHRSYQLFWIWLSKSWWVTQAIGHNFFNSSIFVWSDIGCFRNARYRGKTMFRHPEMVPRRAILQMAHHAPNPPKELFWNDKYNHKPNFYHSGSQAAGYADTWKAFHGYFVATFEGFVERGMFVGEDQVILQSTCRQHPTLCAYVRHVHVVPQDNHYFGLRYVLHLGGNYTYWYHPPLTPEEGEVVKKVSSSVRNARS